MELGCFWCRGLDIPTEQFLLPESCGSAIVVFSQHALQSPSTLGEHIQAITLSFHTDKMIIILPSCPAPSCLVAMD